MIDPTLPLSGLSPVGGKDCFARFDGGMLSSNNSVFASGRTVWRAFIDHPRCPYNVLHSLADITGFRMKMIAAGYEDGNDANRLRSNPILTMARYALHSGSGSGLPLDDVPAGEPAPRCGNSSLWAVQWLPLQ
ncbi:hypothetical protein [Mesorhizobium sp. WSM2239]|uniref:Transposase DDE domain-containing protein n=2 Tax=unclassified Mesorhizobium TaxID=325217 RepID=A0AAU8D692_9HYPH